MSNLCRSIKRNIAKNNNVSWPTRTKEFYYKYLRKIKNRKTGKVVRNTNLT